MLREATELERLDYQIAPGLANVDGTAARELDLVAARVAYVLDGDAAGDAKKQLLVDAGVPKKRIGQLGTKSKVVVLEDLLDADVYLAAVNAELQRWHEGLQMPRSALTETERQRAVASWCKRRRPAISGGRGVGPLRLRVAAAVSDSVRRTARSVDENDVDALPVEPTPAADVGPKREGVERRAMVSNQLSLEFTAVDGSHRMRAAEEAPQFDKAVASLSLTRIA